MIEKSSFRTKLIGTLGRNYDGILRQDVLKNCKPGQTLVLKHSPVPQDPNGVAVFTEYGAQIGWLNKDYSKTLASAIIQGIPIEAEIAYISYSGFSGLGCEVNLSYYVSVPETPKEFNTGTYPHESSSYPGVLWLLPIFFGLVGGVIGAVIAGTVYKSKNWLVLLLGGFFITVILYLLLTYSL